MKENKTIFLIIAGFAGSGKTTIGKEISKRLNWVFIDKDTVSCKYTDFILEQNGTGSWDRESEYYTRVARPLEYEASLDICIENLSLGNNVIYVAPFIAQIASINKLDEIIDRKRLKDMNVDMKIIWIEHNDQIEHERIVNRKSERDKSKLDNWEVYSNNAQLVEPDYENLNVFKFYNDKSKVIGDQFDNILKWLN